MTTLRLARASEPLPAPALPRPMLVFPDGVTVPRHPRGVFRADYLRGDCFRVYAVDSAGDGRGMERYVPASSGIEGLRAAEAELWRLLDAVDPVVRPMR